LSDFQKETWAMLRNKKFSSSSKLLLTHNKKEHYVIHFALLQFFVQMGAIISKVYRVMQYHQSAIFKSYIDFNSQRRAAATNKFIQDYFKLKNNSLYGKLIENVRRHMDFRLCNNAKKLKTYAAKPTVESFLRFSDDLVGVKLIKQEVLLDKPVYMGQAVLDLSKLIMYRLRYGNLRQYETMLNGKISVIGCDTDSLFLKLSNIPASILLQQMAQDNLLDTSNYATSHSLYSITNKARLGCIKDEMKGIVSKI
jgi:hypothetical protein